MYRSPAGWRVSASCGRGYRAHLLVPFRCGWRSRTRQRRLLAPARHYRTLPATRPFDPAVSHGNALSAREGLLDHLPRSGHDHRPRADRCRRVRARRLEELHQPAFNNQGESVSSVVSNRTRQPAPGRERCAAPSLLIGRSSEPTGAFTAGLRTRVLDPLMPGRVLVEELRGDGLASPCVRAPLGHRSAYRATDRSHHSSRCQCNARFITSLLGS